MKASRTKRRFAAVLAVLCVALCFPFTACAGRAERAADTPASAGESAERQLYGAPSVILRPASAEALTEAAASSGPRPASVILTLGDGLDVMAADGSVIGSFADVLPRVRAFAIPVVSVGTQAVAEAFAAACDGSDTEDMAVMSDDAAVLSFLRTSFPQVRGILDCSGRDLRDRARIVTESTKAMAATVVLSQAQSDLATVGYFQSRLKTVWTMLEDDADVFDVQNVVSSGCYGLIGRDSAPVFEAYALYGRGSADKGERSGLPGARYSLNIAHRGLPYSYAENTVEGAAAAVAAGATHIEIDARLSADGEIVIMHDDNLSRTTDYEGDDGRIADMTWDEIRRYSVCRIMGRSTDPCRIPVAEDFFREFADAQVVIIFEIKSREPLLVSELRRLIERYDFWDRIVVISFDVSVLTEMRRILPEIPTAYLSGFSPDSFAEDSRRFNAIGAVADLRKQYMGDAAYLATLGDRGYMSFCWTADAAEECRTLSAVGVFGITNNMADVYGREVCRIEGKAGQSAAAQDLENGRRIRIVTTAYNGKQKKVTGTVFAVRRADGELMLTILASYAQEESLSVSENMKWRIRRNFEEGKPWSGLILGYRFENGQFVVVPEEAEIVKRIFREYLDGLGATAIMKGLNEDGIRTRLGKAWRTEGVLKILRNYNYTGNLILQKTYRENHLTKRKMKNNGERPQYHAVGTHEAIIDLATFEAVQEEIARRAEHYSGKKPHTATYPFTGLIVCANCGKHYRRKTTATGIVWICSTYNTHGKTACVSKAIPENVLYDLTADTHLGDLTAISAEKDNTLIFCFKNGEQTVKRWKDRSRAESWTDAMKETARQYALAQHSKI